MMYFISNKIKHLNWYKWLSTRNTIVNIVAGVKSEQEWNANWLVAWENVPIQIFNLGQDRIQPAMTLALGQRTDIVDQ